MNRGIGRMVKRVGVMIGIKGVNQSSDQTQRRVAGQVPDQKESSDTGQNKGITAIKMP